MLCIQTLNQPLKSAHEITDTNPNISFNLKLRKKRHHLVATH